MRYYLVTNPHDGAPIDLTYALDTKIILAVGETRKFEERQAVWLAERYPFLKSELLPELPSELPKAAAAAAKKPHSKKSK